ncbi:SpoIIE family protein phosphatase [Halobacteriovorax sp. HLS]|uniref:SpoIIE family protein phosphatase n=1 Tax=Halobacteriovorax sp. HLS TaxID=2234000 RepID=UPI000FD7DD22|nr:SpoIIE family protein phosphatase [Halobacteriovorax sp. HLS]
MAILIGGSIAVYALFAMDLFQKDKSAYIYGTNKSTNESFSSQIVNELDRNTERLKLLSVLQRDKVKDFLNSFKGFYSIEISDSSGRDDKFYSVAYIEKENISLDEFKEINSSYVNSKDIEVIKDQQIQYLRIRVNYNETRVIANISLSAFLKISSQFPLYNSYILDLDGNEFWSSQSDHESLFSKEILQNKVSSAVFEVEGHEKYILAYKIEANRNFIFVSKIKKEFAYKVNTYLINKSKVFGVVILSLAGLIALLFSRSLTSPLESLYKLTQKFSNGDFGESVAVTSRDEIGSLGESFNFMSKEILRYMKQMEEKARLEAEVKTAKYVQSTYFPEDRIELEKANISSFYTPAAECGGDWWGYIEFEDKLIVVITDATGHGVPAALLTATAHCCLENIKEISKTNKELIGSPSKILEFMNKSIQCLDGKLLMTAFCCVIDYKEQYILYSNASHNPPFLFNGDNEPSKKSFAPLLNANGPRLGHKEVGEYEDLSIAFKDGQRLILFTDGILESTNSEKTEYGQRRFLKSIINNSTKTNFLFKKSVIDEAWAFYDGEPINDDVTFLSVEFGSRPTSISVDLENEELVNSIKNISGLLLADLVNADFIVTDKLTEIRDNTFYVSTLSDEENVLNVLCKPELNHLVGGNAKRIDLELQNNFQQYYNFKGIKNYLNNKNIEEIVFKSKADFLAVNKCIEEFEYRNCFQSPVDYLKIISNELLTNALYHSGEGEVFEQRSTSERTEDIQLTDNEMISFKLGCDDNYLAISVKDSTGKLTKDILVKSLIRSFESKKHEDKKGGAGLGLYLAYSYSNQFILNTVKDVSSEVICIIDVNKRFKLYKERITSFHYFEQKGS